jgi:hypothetical protein
MFVIVLGTREGCRIDGRLDVGVAKEPLIMIVDDIRWWKLLEGNSVIAHH